jgi:flagellar transcriptional activator FlhC
MISATCSTPFLTWASPCGNQCHHAGCQVALCKQATRIEEALHLVRLGARAGLVCQLTGLDKAPVNRLFWQMYGAPSPSGQLPFSDGWYRENDLRMLHATLVWRLHQQLTRTGRSAARILIDVFESYRRIVPDPVLDFGRAVLVPRLVAMETWEERSCRICEMSFLAPVDSNTTECPGCRIYHRYRCRLCGSPLAPHAKGRRRLICNGCLARARRATRH